MPERRKRKRNILQQQLGDQSKKIPEPNKHETKITQNTYQMVWKCFTDEIAKKKNQKSELYFGSMAIFIFLSPPT